MSRQRQMDEQNPGMQQQLQQQQQQQQLNQMVRDQRPQNMVMDQPRQALQTTQFSSPQQQQQFQQIQQQHEAQMMQQNQDVGMDTPNQRKESSLDAVGPGPAEPMAKRGVSKSCHVCGHAPRNRLSISCLNLDKGLCRKIVCEKCLRRMMGDEADRVLREEIPFECFHCRSQCPSWAQCTYYTRANAKRKPKAELAGTGSPAGNATTNTTNSNSNASA
mmetsp:Transcript_14269/g.24470  ORF Transcript_14269/g.24470 Transcript_14269/m.24470 type:complete len:218 (+) Transcript_14269:2-655(+)